VFFVTVYAREKKFSHKVGCHCNKIRRDELKRIRYRWYRVDSVLHYSQNGKAKKEEGKEDEKDREEKEEEKVMTSKKKPRTGFFLF